MSLRVPLLVRTLAKVRSGNAELVRADDLAAFYRVWGVDLSFQDGPDFSYDPTDDPAEVDELRQQYQPASPNASAPALVIVAAACSEGRHVNGMLLDTQRRGICAIFTRSTRFASGDADVRFEIVAHEIGHMLNLLHGFADMPYPTAMNQYDQRATADRQTVWQRHIDSTPADARTAMAGFFGNGTRSPIGLPLSPRCHQHIIGSSLRDVLPWGTQFNDAASEIEDMGSPVDCLLSIRRAVIEVGQPLDIAVTLVLGDGVEPVPIPLGLGLSEGTIELHIHGEHGSRKYCPRKLLCAEGIRFISPRDRVRRSYSVLGDGHGLLFPRPGIYMIEARVPALGVRSETIDLLVGAPTEELALPQLQAFLDAGLPSEDRIGWRLLGQASRNPKIHRAVRAHFANEIASRRPADAGAIDRLMAAAKEESPRTYQKNLLLRLSRISRNVPKAALKVSRLIEEAESALREDDEYHPSLEFIQTLRDPDARREDK